MEKEKFLLPKKVSFLIFFILLFTYNSTFSQTTCTNPTPTGNASQDICKTASTIDDLIATGGTIVWYDAPSGGELYGGIDVLINGNTYYADDISGSNCSTSRLAVTVTIYGDFPTNVDVIVGKCAIDKPTIGNLSATGQNIEWYDAQTGGNFLPDSELLVNGITYWVQQTENGCTSDRLPTMVSLIDPPTPTTSSIQPFCYPPNPTIGDLQSSGTNVLWYPTETSLISLKKSELLINGEDYWVAEISFPCVSSKRAQTTVLLVEAPYAGTDGSYPVCEINLEDKNLFSLLGDTPDTGGTWTAPDGSAHSENFIAGTDTAGIYTYTVSGGINCPDDSAIVTVAITVVPAPIITDTTQSFCIPDLASSPTLDDLTIDTVGAGNNIRWYADETSTLELNPSTTTLANNTTYWASQFDPTSGCESATRDSKTALIEIAPNAGTDGSYSDCEINLVNTNLFSLLGGSPDAGGIWTAPDGSAHSETFVAGTDVAGVYTYTVAGGTICPDAIAIVTVAITVVPAPVITDANQSFCIPDLASSPTLDKLTVDTVVAGNNVRWYADETSTVELNPSTTILTNNTTYWASQFDPASNCESATRDSKTALIEIAPNAGTDGLYSDCEINLVNTNLFSLLGGSPDAGGIWTAPDGSAHSETFVAGTDVAGVYSYTVAGGTICPDDTSIVTISITVVPPPTIADTTQTFCKSENAIVSDLIPNDASIIWHDASGTVLAPSDTLSDGIYSASQTNDISGTTCESINRTNVTVVIYNPIEPTTIDSTQEFCLSDSPTIANLQAEASNAAYTIIWYDAAGTVLAPSVPLSDGTYYAAETISDCESAGRLAITVTINDTLPPTVSTITQSFCASSSPEISNLIVSGTGIVWYASETDNTALISTDLLVDSADYWAAQTNSATGCISSVRKVVNVILTDPGTPTIISLGNEFCKIDKPKLSDLNVNVSANSGGTISWYDSYPNGNLLSTSIALVEGETYFAIETTVNSCESINPLAVTVSLEACDAYDVEIYDGFSPSGNGVNDTFKLGNLRDLYPNFKVEFYNRWGSLVYTANAAKQDWNGRLNGDGELVPAGVYYFIINFNKNDRKPIQRRLYLSR